MKKMLKTKLSVLLILLLTAVTVMSFGTATVNAKGTTTSQQIGNSTLYIHDFADLLTKDEEKDLIEDLQASYENLNFNILILTTNDTDGKSTMVYSDDYMDALFPYTDKNIGFVIDMKHHKVYINTMGDGIRKISDSEVQRAIDAGYSSLKNEKYSSCFSQMAAYSAKLLSATEGSGVVPTEKNLFSKFLFGMLQYAIAGILIAVFVCYRLIARHRKANMPYTAAAYVANNDYDVVDRETNYIRSFQTIQRGFYSSDTDHSSHSGGGSSHTSSSGRSHGGGGRSF